MIHLYHAPHIGGGEIRRRPRRRRLLHHPGGERRCPAGRCHLCPARDVCFGVRWKGTAPDHPARHGLRGRVDRRRRHRLLQDPRRGGLHLRPRAARATATESRSRSRCSGAHRRAPAPGRVYRTVFMRTRRVNEKYLSGAAPSPADLQPPPSRRHRAGDPVRVNEAEPRLNCRYPGSRRVVWAHVGGGAALRDLAHRLLRRCTPVSRSPGSYGFFSLGVHSEFHFIRSL